MAIMVSPGVNINEVDLTSYTPLYTPPSNAFIIIGSASNGPVNTPRLLNSVAEFENMFGLPLDLSGLTAVKILQTGTQIYYIRFFNGDETADASFLKMTLTGTGGNLVLTAKYPGELTSGQVKAVVTAATHHFTFTVISSNGGVDTTLVPSTTLSLESADSDFYGTWVNGIFTIALADEDNAATAITPGTYNSTDGANGVEGTFANNATGVEAAIEIAADPESLSGIILAAPLYSAISSVALALADVAETRKDFLGQIDHDIASNDTDKVLADFDGIDTSYVALWALKNGYTTDPYSGNALVACPPSTVILPALASMYKLYPIWSPPAGSVRLLLSQLSTADGWSQAERDILYPASINCITNYKGLGWTAVGQKTSQALPSATDRINVRMLANYCKRQIEFLTIPFLYSPIDEITFGDWKRTVAEFLTGIKQKRGVYDYTVKMDWETVTTDAVNNNLMPGIVKIKPTKVAEFIDVDLVLVNYSDQI